MPSPPKTAKGRATRERIVAAATALVCEHGVRATSLDEVRLSARVSKSQLYHYFDDKADLIRAVIGHTTDLVLEAQQPQIESLDSWPAIAEWFDALVAIQERRNARGGCPIGSLVSQVAEEDERARRALAASYDQWQDHLVRGLSTMRERGELRAYADPATLGTATIAAIQGGLVLSQAHRDAGQLRIALDAAYEHLRRQAA